MAVRNLRPMTPEEEDSGVVKTALASADVDFLYAIAYGLECLPTRTKDEQNFEILKDEIARQIISNFRSDEVRIYSDSIELLKNSEFLSDISDENAYRFFLLFHHGSIYSYKLRRFYDSRFPTEHYGRKEFIADLFCHLKELNFLWDPSDLDDRLKDINHSYNKEWRKVFESDERKRLCELWDDEYFSPVMAYNVMKALEVDVAKPKNHIDILIFMDKILDSKIPLREDFIKKIARKISDKRSKSTGKKSQKNLTLSIEVIQALDKLAEKYGATETLVATCLIMEELENPTHLENISHYAKKQ